ncbi:MAG: ATP synthase F1 subunit delta [Candidatus Izemoplasmataceae bacterium]|jgi:F-type H+-transporting ATPase subunit delta|uniref:ATP synthase F1 subunit delta n=1 Tax=Liberiplasma polymorphum TaxID=3374570 RepID=UPI0037738A57
MSAISDQYSVALFELAIEEKIVKELNQVFSDFVESIDEESIQCFLHPRISKKEKKAMIESFKLDPLFRDFLYVLIENNRFLMLNDILSGYQKLVEEQHKLMRIIVKSGKALTQEKIEILTQQYEKKYQRQVLIENEIDETIVGGLKFEYNGVVIDDTVNHTLNQLKSRLTK